MIALMADSIPDLLKELRWSLRHSQLQMAELLGVKRSTYANWEVGVSTPPDPVLKRVREMGSGRQAQVLGNPVIPVGFPGVSIRYAGTVPAGEWGDPLASEDFIEIEAKFEHPRRYAARVEGDSCYPALQQGDLTIWHEDRSPPYGVIVLAQRKGDHGCTVKELVYDGENHRPRLEPINRAYGEPDDLDGWGVIARLVAVLRTVDGLEASWYLPTGLRPRHLL